MVKKWLAGDKVRCNKLMGKNDTEFKADVTMKYNPDSVYNAPDFTLEFVMMRKKTYLNKMRYVFFLNQNRMTAFFDNSLVKLSCKIVHNIFV